MDLDDHPVGAGRDRGARHRNHLVAQPGAVARIRDHRQVRQPLHERNRREIEEIARHRVEAADAALAQNHLAVSLGEDVLRAHEKLGDRGRHAALEQHRLVEPSDGAEQRIVLHVARADLNAICVLGHEMRALFVERLGHDGQTRFAPREREQLESLLAESLKRVR